MVSLFASDSVAEDTNRHGAERKTSDTVDTQPVDTQPDDIVPVDIMISQLKQVPCLFALGHKTLSDIAAHTRYREASTGDIIFSAGQYEAEDIFCCLGGQGQITLGDPQEGSIFQVRVMPGDVIGLDHVLAGQPDLASGTSLQATSDMQLLVIESDAIRTAVADNHQVAMVMLREMARRVVSQSIPGIENDACSTVRISRILCDMAERDEATGMWRIDPMPRHRDLSVLVGASEKQAAEALACLIGKQVLKRDYPGMMITDYPALMAFSGE